MSKLGNCVQRLLIKQLLNWTTQRLWKLISSWKLAWRLSALFVQVIISSHSKAFMALFSFKFIELFGDSSDASRDASRFRVHFTVYGGTLNSPPRYLRWILMTTEICFASKHKSRKLLIETPTFSKKSHLSWEENVYRGVQCDIDQPMTVSSLSLIKCLIHIRSTLENMQSII